jgi:hypothetical protein
MTTQAELDDLILTGWLHPEDPDRPLAAQLPKDTE